MAQQAIRSNHIYRKIQNFKSINTQKTTRGFYLKTLQNSITENTTGLVLYSIYMAHLHLGVYIQKAFLLSSLRFLLMFQNLCCRTAYLPRYHVLQLHRSWPQSEFWEFWSDPHTPSCVDISVCVQCVWFCSLWMIWCWVFYPQVGDRSVLYQMSWSSGCSGHICRSQKVELAARWFSGCRLSLSELVSKRALPKEIRGDSAQLCLRAGSLCKMCSRFPKTFLMRTVIGKNSLGYWSLRGGGLCCLDVMLLVAASVISSALCSNSKYALQFVFRSRNYPAGMFLMSCFGWRPSALRSVFLLSGSQQTVLPSPHSSFLVKIVKSRKMLSFECSAMKCRSFLAKFR